MVVHDTPCSAVTEGMVAEGLADQYLESVPQAAAGGWIGTDYRFADSNATVTDCMVTVPKHQPLHPSETPTASGPKVPKDGPTMTREGKVIEGDQPREIQGAAPTEPFTISQGSWGQPYPDQWYLKAVHWLKEDGTSVLPDNGTPVTVAIIDTGVDLSHPELAEAKWINRSPSPAGDINGWNFVDQSPDIREPGLTPRSVLEKFAAVQMIDVHLPTTDGRELLLTRYTEPEPELNLLLKKLKLELPAQPQPKITASASAPPTPL
jgi:hypothetical protein